MSTSLSAWQSPQQIAVVLMHRSWKASAILILIVCTYNRAGKKKRQIIVPTPNRLLANLQRSLRQQLANLKPRWENALNGHVNNKGRNGTASLADGAQRPRGFGAVPGLNPAPVGEMRQERGRTGTAQPGFSVPPAAMSGDTGRG